MSASLAQRMARLLPAAAPPTPAHGAATPGVDALTELIARIERLHGGKHLAAPAAAPVAELAAALDGELLEGGIVRVRRNYPLTHRHGDQALGQLAACTQDHAGALRWPRRIAPQRLLFFDTETTGLAGGSGTLAFMVGVGRLAGASFVLTQYFMQNFAAEAALLAALAGEIYAESVLVSFNGRSFDAPLIATRCQLARRPDPLAALPHLDLLHALRRAAAGQLPNCRLQSAEAALLGLTRKDDLPGQLAPRAWTRWLGERRADWLAALAQHNRDDILSLAVLLPLLAGEPARLCEAPAPLRRRA
ncbi:MAG: ribonuclease H-like domain-containing protein [Rhodocyclaceae bacterium]|nr:ribonuclease H-like domain-containing protein [Rhodocyclaceae bacterium]